MTGPLLSPAPTTPFVIGGVYNVASPAPISGQGLAIQLDANGNVLVNIAAGSTSGVQYVDGVTQATPTGTVALGKNPSNVLHSLALSALGNLNVNLAEGTISGGNAAASPTGAAVPASADYQGVNIGGNLVGVTGLALGATTKAPTIAIVDGAGNQITSFGGGTQFADNSASGATPTGTLAMGWDSVNSKIRALKVDASQDLFVAFATAQHVIVDSGSISITGTPTVDVTDRAARLLGHVTVDNASLSVTQGTSPWIDDPIDRAARLLGVVYGSQGQQIKQTAVNFNSQVELATGATLYDARQIRALTSADVVSAVQSGLWNVNQAIGVAGFEKITDGTNTAAVKAASTAPVATDPALVVAISPNTPTLPISGTVTANQGGAPWSENLTQVGGGAVSLGAKTSANSIPVVLATDEATLPVSIAATVNIAGTVSVSGTVNVSVQNATLAVTQSTSPWVDNVSQFGGNPVVTGTGVSGAGIPRMTVSSDSFPATQVVSVVSLPLPVNAAQETGGNLATIATQLANEPQVNDTLNMILGQLKLLNLNIATCIPSAYVDSDSFLLDSIPTSGR